MRFEVLRFTGEDGAGVAQPAGRRLYYVVQINVHPNLAVALVDGCRAAQIMARRLNERHPDARFSFQKAGLFEISACDPDIRATAHSRDVCDQVRRELREEIGNFNDLPKWIVFFYDRGSAPLSARLQFGACPEHDPEVVRRCLADPDLTGTTEIFCDHLTTEDGMALLNAHSLDCSPSGNPEMPFVETVLLNKQMEMKF